MVYSIVISLLVAGLVFMAPYLPPLLGIAAAVVGGIIVFFSDRVLQNLRFNDTMRDITQQMPPALVVGAQSETELGSRISDVWVDREQMSMVLSEIREGVLAVDRNQCVILANNRADEMLGHQSLVGVSIESIDLPNAVLLAMEEALEGRPYEGDWKIGAKPDRRYFEVVGLPISGQQGCLLVFRDITKIRKLERVRRDFVANISHELRTPITIVRANAETLLNGAMKDPEFGPRFLSAILRNGERLSRLINDLLDLSRIEAGEYTMNVRKFPIKPLVERVLETLQEKYLAKKQKIDLQIEEDSWAYLDEQAFEQIVTNYIDNAIKYTPDDSNIIIRTVEADEKLFFEVEDDGPGILAKHRPRLFERFYRVDKGRSRDAGGTGLGLSIVRHLAEAMGADVGMRGSDPTGSVFWCSMSRSQSMNPIKSDLA